jgi:hypothetical protein
MRRPVFMALPFAALLPVLGCGNVDSRLSQAPVPDAALLAESGIGALALAVPATTTHLQIDGEAREQAWKAAATTGAFVDSALSSEAHPYSEVRFLANKTLLYFLFYAADEEVDSSDHFEVEMITERNPEVHYLLSIAADGRVLASALKAGDQGAWNSGIRAAATLRKPSDEEWVIEAALPLVSLGVGGHDVLDIALRRCDTAQDATTRCGTWGRASAGSISGRLILPAP